MWKVASSPKGVARLEFAGPRSTTFVEHDRTPIAIQGQLACLSGVQVDSGLE
jgi:hypothetical protein